MGEYAIYLRKSRRDNELEKLGQGETLTRHRQTLTGLAKKMGLYVTKIYEEIVSGESISIRPQIRLLLQEVERNKFDGVLVMEVERLARGDTLDQGIVAQTFRLTRTKIITPQKVYDPINESDEEYFEFGLFMSRREYKTINRRLQAGRIASVKEGSFIGSVAPYGYKRVKREKYWTLEEDEKADNVRLVYKLFVDDLLSISQITTTLDKIGVKPKKANKWSYSSVREILSNPVYTGKILWNRRCKVLNSKNGIIAFSRPRNSDKMIVSDGLHKEIIDEKKFEQAQILLKHKSFTKKFKYNKMYNCFSGLLYCGKCKKAMVMKVCNGKSRLCCLTKGCGTSSYDYEELRNAVFDYAQKKLGDYEKSPQLKGDKNIEQSQSRISLMKKSDELSNQKEKLYELLEKEIYSPDLFMKRMNELESRLVEINLLINQEKSTSHSQIIKLKNAFELLKNSDCEKQNEFLKALFSKIFYYREKSDRFHQNDIRLELYLRKIYF